MSSLHLTETAAALFADNKGLLAMDESTPTCDKRFAKLGIPLTEEARRAYREMILTTPGLGENISGVILYDETIRQKKKDGTPFLKVIYGLAFPIGSWQILGPHSADRYRSNQASSNGRYEQFHQF